MPMYGRLVRIATLSATCKEELAAVLWVQVLWVLPNEIY